jgi:hypothetical protein
MGCKNPLAAGSMYLKPGDLNMNKRQYAVAEAVFIFALFSGWVGKGCYGDY